jgi:hypothetical protein
VVVHNLLGIERASQIYKKGGKKKTSELARHRRTLTSTTFSTDGINGGGGGGNGQVKNSILDLQVDSFLGKMNLTPR